MFMLLSISAFDPSLGKIDKHSFTQQFLMEIVVQPIENADLLCGSRTNPNDVKVWKGIGLNSAFEIHRIVWANKRLLGTIHLQ